MPGTNVPAADVQFDSQTTADQVAQAYARWFNIKEHKADVIFRGQTVWPNGIARQSGSVITFINKGLFNGNWIVRKVIFELDNSLFRTQVNFRKCLNPKDYPLLNTTLANQDLSGE